MTDDQLPPGTGWMAEPLHPVVVSGPSHYALTTDGPIQVLDVRDGTRVLGYLWASLDDEAADFEPHEASGDDAFNAATDWHVALREPRSRGLGARAALDELVATGGPDRAGRIVADSRREMASLAELAPLARS